MTDYDEMTNADVMSSEEMREYDQAAEALLDAQDEERWAAEEAAAAQPDDEEPYEGLADGEER
ncbi:hypothetical protein [Streptomyces nitrosporeus]|uniref:hypothetical protein n=1 Tax=Streptomyces nitrosporeus TaxID=28894 RepID=UPI0039A38B79